MQHLISNRTNELSFVNIDQFHPCDILLFHTTNMFSPMKGSIHIGLMHSDFVNGYQLLYDARTVSDQDRGTTDIFFYITHFHHFLLLKN